MNALLKPLISSMFSVLFSCVIFAHTPTMSECENKAAVRAAFEAWRNGTGGPFNLLAADATWTITGNSFVARTYQSRDEFINHVIRPFNARLAVPLVPTVQNIYSEGDTVIVLFTAVGVAMDGRPYRNTYAWFMKMKESKVVDVTAFFDSREFDDFWERVIPPTEQRPERRPGRGDY